MRREEKLKQQGAATRIQALIRGHISRVNLTRTLANITMDLHRQIAEQRVRMDEQLEKRKVRGASFSPPALNPPL